METGDIFSDRYLVRARLDEGGVVETYLAVDQVELTDVVIKLLYLSKVKEWKYVELFERETEILKSVRHSNIPKFYRGFSVDSEKDKVFVTVQEYIKGQTLKQLISSKNRLSEVEIMKITVQLLNVLVYFQEHKPPIIHRDINPKNIILTEGNKKAYLVDLGSVQNYVITDADDYSTVVGSFGYMSPEQSIGKATPASDLYSLGMTIIFMLTGKHPGLIEQVNLRPDYKNTAVSSKQLEVLIDLLIEPDEKKRIRSASEALKILKESKNHKRYNSSIEVYHKIYQNKLPDISNIMLSNTTEGIFINLPKKFGRNLQGTFGKTVLLLNPKTIIIFRSLGSLWKKKFIISVNEAITCNIRNKAPKEKKPKTYLCLETYEKDVKFGHNLSKPDKLFLKEIINDFILNNKRIKKSKKEDSGLELFTSTVKKVGKFIKRIIKDI